MPRMVLTQSKFLSFEFTLRPATKFGNWAHAHRGVCPWVGHRGCAPLWQVVGHFPSRPVYT